MAKETILTAILALALVFGMTVVGCGDGGGDNNNPFIGSWTGSAVNPAGTVETVTITFAESTWTMTYSIGAQGRPTAGTYTWSDNTAVLTADTGQSQTITITGNTIRMGEVTLSKSSGGETPGGDGNTVEGATLAAKLEWLRNNAQSNTTYTITVSANESIRSEDAGMEYPGKNGITIIILGSGSTRIISLSSNGSLFSVRNGVKLILDNNITLQGKSGNTYTGVVSINSGGELEMKTGSKITGNDGSGVYVGGTFTMNGGTISGNTGGGVFVSVDGTFTMNGGEISGNSNSSGGGVFVAYGSGSKSGGSFIMNSGKISGNTATSGGGGVIVSSGSSSTEQGGSFIMNGGEISGNTADNGGGVQISSLTGNNGIFTMNGGTISGNTAKGSTFGGGGVYVAGGIFTMDKGIISGNKASNKDGGGVYVLWSGTFRIANGTVYGSTAATGQANTAASGAALYKYDSGGSTQAVAERGTFSGTMWTSKGTLSATNDTISVENGDLK